MENKLLSKKCVPCEGGVLPFDDKQISTYLQQLTLDWSVIDKTKIQHRFTLKDFLSAMKFVNTVADISEKEGHHPDIMISYNKVTITLWTHAIRGLSQNDFILAAKVEHVMSTEK
ncbi:MAG TPA: 4a-hydroxytetrahydrobiopterin dehydratase [Patescibacteria group bacterium]|nr:4a-hydroxytetrahydrobiopterin dehydratase [Patescibacteria group bacterium]